MTRIVATKNSTHHLSVGPLKGTPIGRHTQEQLESELTLVETETKKAEQLADEAALKRLEHDRSALEAELERREYQAA